jgi:hypothetical protein
MWEIYEHNSLPKKLSKIPKEILMRYEKWKDIVEISGPVGLRMIRGVHDETRDTPEMMARRNWTREWRKQYRTQY